jgi:ribosomal-protein-alanine N-acetyltransferase
MQSLDPLLPVVVQRTAVRRLRTSDVERFHAYRSDAGLAIYQGWSPMSLEGAYQFVAEMAAVQALRCGDWVQLAIADVDTDVLLGDVGLYVEADGSIAEIGFTLNRAAQGFGHPTRAVQASLSLVFAASSADVVRGITDSRNGKSIRVLERVGFSRSHARQAVFKGEPCTELVYLYDRPDA